MNGGIKLSLYRGKVIDINDSDKEGKIKVKLLPQMKDIKDENLPWFEPFEGNSSDNELRISTPEVGSLIWLLADDKFYRRYYTTFKYNIKGLYDFSKVESMLDDVGVDTTYENIQFTYYQDGSLDFHNRDDGSHGFISSSGASLVVKSDASIEVGNSKATVVIGSDGAIAIDSDSSLTVNNASDINITSDTNITVDATANTTLKAKGFLTLDSGDAVAWSPNIIPACLFTGSVHSGITKLKGA